METKADATKSYGKEADEIIAALKREVEEKDAELDEMESNLEMALNSIK